MPAESFKGYEPKVVVIDNKVTNREVSKIETNKTFSIDLSSFISKKQRELQKQLAQLQEEDPEAQLDINEQMLLKILPEKEEALFNLKNFLDSKQTLVGNKTLRLIEKSGFPFVILESDSAEPLEMGLMEFLRMLDKAKGLSNIEAYTLFHKTIDDNLHPKPQTNNDTSDPPLAQLRRIY
jgi:hypothetical protein